MTKKQHKWLGKLFLGFYFLGIGILLTSCEAEKDFAKTGKANKNEISFAQFKKETGLHDFKTKIHVEPHHINSSTARLADGSYELSDFDVSTEYIKKLESGDRKSYTFRIYPKDSELILATKSIFNLALSRKEEGNWETKIIEFKPTQLNLEKIKAGLTEMVEGKAKLLYKGNLTTYGSSAGGCDFILIDASNCEGCTGDHCDAFDPGGCPWGVCFHYFFLAYLCIDGGAGSSSGDSGGPPGDGSTSGGLGDGNAVTIVPYDPNSDNIDNIVPIIANVRNTSFDDVPHDNNPCQDLKTNTADLQFRQRLNTLNKPFYFNKDHETGFAATKNGNVKGFSFVESPLGEHTVNFGSIPNVVSYFHVHNDDYQTTDNNGEPATMYTAKIPSAKDLFDYIGIQNKAYQLGMNSSQIYGITLSSAAIYCFKLKVASTLEMNTFLNNLQNTNGFNWDVFKKDLDDATKEILNKNLSDSEEKIKMEELLLKSLKKSQLDQFVGLYEGTSMGSGLYADVAWKEKYLDENSSVQEKPCNN